MNDDRRARFISWFERTFTGPNARTTFMQQSGATGAKPYTKGRISQFFDKDQPFGERAAREIAIRFRLPETFFEPFAPQEQSGQDEPMYVTPAERAIIMQIRSQATNTNVTPLKVERTGGVRSIASPMSKSPTEKVSKKDTK